MTKTNKITVKTVAVKTLVKEFQRLKEEEQKQIGWSAKRELSKINYYCCPVKLLIFIFLH